MRRVTKNKLFSFLSFNLLFIENDNKANMVERERHTSISHAHFLLCFRFCCLNLSMSSTSFIRELFCVFSEHVNAIHNLVNQIESYISTPRREVWVQCTFVIHASQWEPQRRNDIAKKRWKIYSFFVSNRMFKEVFLLRLITFLTKLSCFQCIDLLI